MSNHIIGLAIGLCVGVADCALFAATGEPLTAATIVTAISFWATIGWAVHNADVPVPSVLKGILVSWFFNLPWVVEFVVNQGQADLLIPMLVLGTAFGAVIGFASQIFSRRSVARAGGAHQ